MRLRCVKIYISARRQRGVKVESLNAQRTLHPSNRIPLVGGWRQQFRSAPLQLQFAISFSFDALPMELSVYV